MSNEILIFIPIKAINTVEGNAIERMISLMPFISVLFFILFLRANPNPINRRRISVFWTASTMVLVVMK